MCPIPKKAGFKDPVFKLKEEEEPPTEKENSVTYTLKVRANATGQNIQTYKRILRRFEEGSPEAFIKTLQGLREIWIQNGVTTASDREATVKTVLKGESWNQFAGHLKSLTETTAADGTVNVIPSTVEHVEAALSEVGNNVFPHDALKNQKQWMRRNLHKPSDMPIRKMVSAVVRINSYLPYLPGATENDKFSDVEVVELLEFSLPPSWRAKFDLERFVPTDHDRAKLIEMCEALERSLPATSKDKIPKKKPKTAKHKVHGKKPSWATKYCARHGWCAHSTEECTPFNPALKKPEQNKPCETL